jgi:glutamine cyclotransferase
MIRANNKSLKAKPSFLRGIIILPILLLFFSWVEASDNNNSARYRIDSTYPHDNNAQTEGLIIHNGFLYEGTGPCLDGPSSLRKIDLKTGEVLKNLQLPGDLFGEGITIFDDRVIQLTYKSKTGFVYDLASFKPLGEFHYDTEGWGLTHDGENLIMSDGTALLHFLSPVTFKKIREVKVTDENGEVPLINELEYINGDIYANIFMTPYIVRISPQTGRVIEKIDLSKLLNDYFLRSARKKPANGIAYDPDTRSMYITGKYWEKVYRIRIFD